MGFKSILTCLTLALLYQSLPAQMPLSPVAPEDEAAARRIIEQYRTAWLRGDEAGVLSLFEERGRIQPSGMCPFDSLHNIRSFWFPTDGSITTIHQFDIDIQEVLGYGKDMIFLSLTNRLYWSYQLGDTKMGKLQYGYAQTAFRRQPDGGWKIWRQAWTDLKSVNIAPIAASEPPFKVAFEIPENDLVPEGLAFDATTSDLFLSSTWKRKILKISPDSRATEFAKTGQDGLLGVIGMKVDAERRLLWVCTGTAGEGMPVQGLSGEKNWKSAIFKYDLKTGKCLRQFWLEEPDKSFFFNDLTIDKTGRVYATEMLGRRLYSIAPEGKTLEVFLQLPEGHAPNGIDLDDGGRYLFVALYTNPRSFGRIDLQTQKLEFVSLPPGEEVGADGLYFYKNSLIAVQPSVKDRAVTQYFLNESHSKIVGTRVLLPDDPALAQPSTGAVAGGRFYFIGTSQLQAFAKMWRDGGGKVDASQLQPVKIGVVGL
ncbi:MAG: SMP-30/gluconolactonase/LRE family protein [Saprospiraceae bacterium]